MKNSKDLREVRAILRRLLADSTLDQAVRMKLEKVKREFDNMGKSGEIDRKKVYLLTRILCELIRTVFAGDNN